MAFVKKIRIDFVKNWIKAFLKQSKYALYVLISIDLLFIGVHFLHEFTDLFNDIDYSIERDQGYAEIFNYLKWVTIIGILIYFTIKNKENSLPYVSWILIFTYCLLDDAKSGHETLGMLLALHLGESPMGFDPQGLAELLIFTVVFVSILALLIVAFYYGSKQFRIFSAIMFLLFGAFAFFGIAVDLMHSFFTKGSVIELMIGAVEDGGEMIVASIMLCYALTHTLEPKFLNKIELQYSASQQ